VLSELGHEVIVAHARNVRLIGESRRKDDRFDARTLARLARIDPQLLAPVQHRSAQAQSHLMVIRARAGLVRARTALINTARGLTKSYGERLRSCNPRYRSLRGTGTTAPPSILGMPKCPPRWKRSSGLIDPETAMKLS
jgi:transposase